MSEIDLEKVAAEINARNEKRIAIETRIEKQNIHIALVRKNQRFLKNKLRKMRWRDRQDLKKFEGHPDADKWDIKTLEDGRVMVGTIEPTIEEIENEES